ncbi:MAG: 30S ribosomal protein S4 [Candidatus Omnitrophica bacterium]|nr:30S ribosomal protein S4 [Candidatus Omnitrophota bacterium]
MGRKIGPVCRLCRREGMKLFLKGIRCTGDKCAIERRNFAPGMHRRGGRGKLSNYALQLREKQKAKRIYGILERQFRVFFARATKKKGITGETLIQLLERRLDNVLYRTLFVSSRPEARQLVSHGLMMVNGRTVNIPSFQVRVGDIIQPYPDEGNKKRILNTLEMLKDRPYPEWLELNRETLEVKVVKLPGKVDAALPVEESQIVELYSK